jgi:hypothetical protein
MGEAGEHRVVQVPAAESAAEFGTPKVFVQVGREWLVEGFELALERFRQAAAKPSETAKEAFWPLFEALNWIYCIQDYEKARGVPLDDPLSRAIRFARNRVQHDWAAALDLVQSPAQPVTSAKPTIYAFIFAWHWKPVDQLPPEGNRRGEDEYRDLLARRPVEMALAGFGRLLAQP